MCMANRSVKEWEALGEKWIELGRLWEAQDAFERAGKSLDLDHLIRIGDWCVELGRIADARTAYALVVIGPEAVKRWNRSFAERVPESDAILTVHEVAGSLGLRARTVTWMDENGLLPRRMRRTRSGERVEGWYRSTIEAWLAAGCPPRRDWDRMKQLAPHFAE